MGKKSRRKNNQKIVMTQKRKGTITLDTDCSYLFDLCYDGELDAVRKYLASNSKDKKQQIFYRAEGRHNSTCLHWACRNGAPDDIVKLLIEIGGKKLVMMKSSAKLTALHYASSNNASHNIMKMLIDVGGKELVMAKSSGDNTVLHCLCDYIHKHDNPTDKIKLILEAVDTEVILQAKNTAGKTALQFATAVHASNEIKELLFCRPSTTVVIDDISKAAEEINIRQPRQITPSKQCTASPTTNINQPRQITPSKQCTASPITNIRQPRQITPSKQCTTSSTKKIRQPRQIAPSKQCTASPTTQVDRSAASPLDTIRQLQKKLKEAQDRAIKIQKDSDEKCADIINLQHTLQVECTEKLQLASALIQKGKQIETLQSQNETLHQQKRKSDEDYGSLKRHTDNLTITCMEHKQNLQAIQDAANSIEAAGGKRKHDNEGDQNDECPATTSLSSSSSSSSSAVGSDSAHDSVLSQSSSKRRIILSESLPSRIASELDRDDHDPQMEEMLVTELQHEKRQNSILWGQLSKTKRQLRKANAQVMELLK